MRKPYACLCRFLQSTKSIYMWLSCVLLPCLFILARQDSVSVHEMAFYLALISVGIGPLYTTWMLLFEGHVPMTEQMFSLAYLCRSLRDLAQPWIFGQFMDSHPLLLIVLGAVGSAASIAFYVGLAIFGSKL